MSIIAALDFETANYSRASACSIGVVILENGKVVDSYYSLIKPLVEPNNFLFSYVHGITSADVDYAPEFDSIYVDVKKFLSCVDLVFAHNSSLDKSVLIDSLYTLGIPLSDFTLNFGDSLSVARKSFSLENYKLPTVAKHIGFNLNHHKAISDAEASARIVEFSQKAFSSSSARDLLLSKNISSLSLNDYMELLIRRRNHEVNEGLISSSSIHEELNYDAEVDKDVVLTGTPDDGKTRAQIAELAKDHGFNIQAGVNKDTDILVTGDWQKGTLKEGLSLSRKAAKALELKSKGQKIQVISYEDFYELLDIL